MDLTKGDIPKLIKTIAIPASIGFFFDTMYNVTDTVFAGMLSTEAIAALGLSFPVFFCIIAIGSGISTGATALISNSLGEGNKEQAKLYANQAISFTILVGIALTIIGYLISPSLFKLLGATDLYLQMSIAYMNVIIFASTSFLMLFVTNGVLNAYGDTQSFRNYLIFGFFLNIILNPILMFGWGPFPTLGIQGLALSTVMIQLLGIVYLAYRGINKGLYHKERSKFIPQKTEIFHLFQQGFPASLNMMTVALGIFIITYFISDFGKEAVAAYGIATRVEQIALLPLIGINIACLSIVGQNNGAKKYDRIKETIKVSMKYGLITSIIGAVLMFLFPDIIMGFFTDDKAVIKIGVDYLPIAAFMTTGYMILFLLKSVLQGVKKPNFAVWIGLYRQIIAPIILFYITTKIFNFDLMGIWWSIFFMVWSSVILTVIKVKLTIKAFEK